MLNDQCKFIVRSKKMYTNKVEARIDYLIETTADGEFY